MLLDPPRWRHAYEAEADRRAQAVRVAVEAQQGRDVLHRMRPGWPLGEVTDPFKFHLEIHPAIASPEGDLPALPEYVPREHDRLLVRAVAEAAEGTSRIVALVGGSSTGKTRACWEALIPLRERGDWRLWHPIDPTRPDAALTELPEIGPRTVVWLNEAQFYLAPNTVGEQVAAGLRRLLEPGRGPVLIFATLWPSNWIDLVTRPPETEPDRHAQARELLSGHNIAVPGAFATAELDTLFVNGTRDPRIAEAVERAPDGQITQYLAGAPLLVDRYQLASPPTKALIDAAIDARRSGAGPYLPLAWLAEAAPGYLTDAEWNQTGDDWLEKALEYVTTPCNGIPGILTPVGMPRNGRVHRAGDAKSLPRIRSLYRLTDYLDHHGRDERRGHIPPIDFWAAAATHAHAGDLRGLGQAARALGLYRDAAQILKKAATHGDSDAAIALIDVLRTARPFDDRSIRDAANHTDLSDPYAVAQLLERLRKGAASTQSATLIGRDPATHVSLDDPYAIAWLLDSFRKAGATDQTTILAHRAATQVSLNDPYAVARLLDSLREAGAKDQTIILAHRAVTQVSLDDPYAVAWLLDSLRKALATEEAAVLIDRNPASRVALENPYGVARLLDSLQEAGSIEQATVLVARSPAEQVALSNPYGVARLLDSLRRAGASEQAASLVARQSCRSSPTARQSTDSGRVQPDGYPCRS
jgi:hypothetical protein